MKEGLGQRCLKLVVFAFAFMGLGSFGGAVDVQPLAFKKCRISCNGQIVHISAMSPSNYLVLIFVWSRRTIKQRL